MGSRSLRRDRSRSEAGPRPAQGRWGRPSQAEGRLLQPELPAWDSDDTPGRDALPRVITLTARRAVQHSSRLDRRATSAPCGCRELVRSADLRFCSGGGHVVMAFPNCAIHPNRASFTRSVPRPNMSDDQARERAVSRHSRSSDGQARHGMSELGTDRGHRDDSDHVARNACSGCPDEFSAPTGVRIGHGALSRSGRIAHFGRRPRSEDAALTQCNSALQRWFESAPPG
jgi:hypothetical protein